MQAIWHKGIMALAIVGTALVLSGPAAWAGEDGEGCCGSVQVFNGDDPPRAYGIFHDTRNAPDGNTPGGLSTADEIGCTVSTSGLTGNATKAHCKAVDDDGPAGIHTLECTTTDPGMVLVAQAIRGSGTWGYFESVKGECTFLEIMTSSHMLPDIPHWP